MPNEDFRRTAADEVGKLEFPGRVLEPYTEAFFNHVDARVVAASRLSAEPFIHIHIYSKAAANEAALGRADGYEDRVRAIVGI